MSTATTKKSTTTRKRTSTGTVVDLFRTVDPVDVPGKAPGRVAQLSPEQARILTTNIKHAVVRVWVLVAEAHDRGAFTALGYETWRDYVVGELQMSESTSYNYLDQARIMRELVSAGVDPNEVEPPSVRVVQRIKDNMPAVRRAAKKAVADGTSIEDALRELASDLTPRDARPVRTSESLPPMSTAAPLEGKVVASTVGPQVPLVLAPDQSPPQEERAAPAPLVFSAEERVEAVKAEMTRGEVLCPACQGLGHVQRKLARAIGPALEELRG